MSAQLPPDETRGSRLVAVWWTEVVVASLFLSLRFWARRYKRNLGVDDAVMLAAWLCFLGEGIIFQYSYQNGGSRHFFYLTTTQQEYQVKLVTIALDIGIACTGLGRIAIGFTILRIIGSSSKWQKWAVILTMTMTILTGILDIFISTFHCGNPQNLWDFERFATRKCLDNKAVYDFNNFCSAWQVFNDFFFSILPMVIVWKTQIALRRKLQVMAGLGLTLLTGVAGSIKTCLTSKLNQADVTWNLFWPLVWFGTESMLIIVCGSIPLLHPLWERLFTKPKPGYASERTYTSQQKYNNLSAKDTIFTRTSKTATLSDLELARLTGSQSQPPASVVTSVATQDRKDWVQGECDGRIHMVNEVNVSSEWWSNGSHE